MDLYLISDCACSVSSSVPFEAKDHLSFVWSLLSAFFTQIASRNRSKSQCTGGEVTDFSTLPGQPTDKSLLYNHEMTQILNVYL